MIHIATVDTESNACIEEADDLDEAIVCLTNYKDSFVDEPNGDATMSQV
jgi:hypothetical protein